MLLNNLESKKSTTKNLNNNIDNKSENNEKENEIEEKEESKKILELKDKINLENIIRSIEFLNKKEILICNSISLNIYEINDSFKLNLIYKIEIEEKQMNYGTVLIQK